MPSFPNFYERLDEARIRLRHTVVMYDNEPYFVLAITDHKSDGKFRIYLDSLARGKPAKYAYAGFPRYQDYDCPGAVLDQWIEANPDKGVERKYMSAAGFNKYRPFPLGNINMNGTVYYSERTPTRNTSQGLRRESIVTMPVSLSPDTGQTAKRGYMDGYTGGSGIGLELTEQLEVYDMLKGNYPTFKETVEALRNPEVTNLGVAFHREFSVFRGPLNMLFLCYQHQGVARILDDCSVVISKDYAYLKEQIESLGVMSPVTVQQ